LFHVTPQNQNSLSSQNIALISCDSRDYPGFTSLTDVFQTALGVNSTAIILYSLTAQQCNVSGLESAFSRLYSMSNKTTSSQLLDHIGSSNTLVATVLRSDSAYLHGNASSNSHGPPSTYASSPTTAVAMIILYSVTGIITALFLIIIITGAVRAHRHPERYGPRNVMGRPRQTRARGIARAMLDTIPVVKFGEHHQPKQEPKVADIEMADSDTPVIRRSAEVEHDQAAPRRSTASARSGIGAAAGHIDTSDTITATSPSQSSEALVCSICTDDFETGQDIRVLPCDHKFHPACIDPWLLNVSSTCPLCRVDLRPEGHVEAEAEAEAAASAAAEHAELPPPIYGYNGQPYRVSMRRSLLIGLGLDRGHIGLQQRMAAARELSTNNPDTTPEAQQQQEQGEEGRQRRRLRERFGIRTRRRGQSDAHTQAVAVPEEASTDTLAVVDASGEQRDHRPASSS
jgi:hypothetical protein